MKLFKKLVIEIKLALADVLAFRLTSLREAFRTHHTIKTSAYENA